MPQTPGRSPQWVDLDGDNDLDLFIAGDAVNGVNHVLVNTDMFFTEQVVSGICAYADHVAWADMDDNRTLDVVLAVEATGIPRVYRNNGGLQFVDVTPGGTWESGSVKVCAWIDYNNDGLQDIFFGHTNTANRLWRNVGNGSFVLESNAVLGTGCTVAKWADYDNDGLVDLYVGGTTENHLYRNLGGGVFSDVQSAVIRDYGGTDDFAWIDVDNSGELDLVCVSQYRPTRVIVNDGGTFSVGSAGLLGEEGGESRGIATVDLGHDGDEDVLLMGENSWRLFRNFSGNLSQREMSVYLMGMASNRYGIGCRLTGWFGGERVERRVTCNSAVVSGAGGWVHISGPGGLAACDSLVIQWPSGQRQQVTSLGSSSVVWVLEGGVAGVESLESGEVGGVRAKPNPFAGALTIEWNLARGERDAAAEIYDVQGRCIQRVVGVVKDGGAVVAMWDGTDRRGRKCPDGVYGVRVGGRRGRGVQHVILLGSDWGR